jgi:diguanylate cyclase (GGDEF)-like protein
MPHSLNHQHAEHAFQQRSRHPLLKRSFLANLLSARRIRGQEDAASVTTRHLTRGYVLGLSLIALLTVAGGWNITRLLEQQAQHAEIINVAGAQRMLSQRIAALALDAVDEAHPQRERAERELRIAAGRLERSHERLSAIARSEEAGTVALQEYYFGDGREGAFRLDDRVREFLRKVAAIGSDPEGLQIAREVHDTALHVLLHQLDRAVSLHEASARERIAFVLDVHLAMVAAALALLALEAFFIFRPLVRRTAQLAGALQVEADRDPLTGLRNRRATRRELDAALAADRPVVAIAIDLDHFKEVNDSEGHEAGDALLRTTAERLLGIVRQGDIVGRLGGDEFVVFLLDMADEQQAFAIAERIMQALNSPVVFKGRQLRLGASLGVARAPQDSADGETLLRIADEVLMNAKREGRGMIGRVRQADLERLVREAAAIKSLRAVAAEGFAGLTAEFQPIVRLSDQVAREVEASFRVCTADGAFLSVEEAVHAASRLGLSRELMWHVRDRVFQEFSRITLGGERPDRLHLDIGWWELSDQNFVQELRRQCEAHCLDMSALTVNLSEKGFSTRLSPHILETLAALRGHGARLCLEDFGMGSLGFLQLSRLPLDEIKIHRSLVSALPFGGRPEQVVNGILRMAEGLGMRAVADGVTTAGEEEGLKRLGCEWAQGSRFGTPLTGEEFRNWWRGRSGQFQGNVLPMQRGRA